MEPPVTEVLYPYMRLDLREFAHSLGDPAHQDRVWIQHRPLDKQDNLTDVVHFFYDDTDLAIHPDRYIGGILKDGSEACAVGALTSALDELFAQLGTEQPDVAYLRAPGWTKVVALARDLVATLDRPDRLASGG